MATRLYPNTTVPANIEKLAGVPAGTLARLDAMRTRHEASEAADPRNQELGYANWKERNADEAIGNLDAFLTYGWGKFESTGDIGLDYSGSEDNLERAATLLNVNGIKVDIALTEGLHWC